MKQYKRSERFNKLLIEEVSTIVQRELKDPRIGFVSFTRVETTDDLRNAKFYVSLLDESQAEDTLAALRHAAGMIRGVLMHRIKAKRIPELRFVYDPSIAYSVHISEVLEQLKHKDDAEGDAEAGAENSAEGDAENSAKAGAEGAGGGETP